MLLFSLSSAGSRVPWISEGWMTGCRGFGLACFAIAILIKGHLVCVMLPVESGVKHHHVGCLAKISKDVNTFFTSPCVNSPTLFYYIYGQS